ncbi:hypothetical protein TELCIR_17744, partial [Teladorsagia circumcincta]
LSFFKKISGSTQFAYILIAQIAHLMMDCAPALNVLNCLKPKICAFVGTYRIVTFKDLVNDPLDDDNSSDELIKPPQRAHSESRMSIEKRKLDVADDDSLLHRLKLNYFNSPDYTIAELREINSD